MSPAALIGYLLSFLFQLHFRSSLTLTSKNIKMKPMCDCCTIVFVNLLGTVVIEGRVLTYIAYIIFFYQVVNKCLTESSQLTLTSTFLLFHLWLMAYNNNRRLGDNWSNRFIRRAHKETNRITWRLKKEAPWIKEQIKVKDVNTFNNKETWAGATNPWTDGQQIEVG